jgi:fibronectin-binding autotransporter adhesin
METHVLRSMKRLSFGAALLSSSTLLGATHIWTGPSLGGLWSIPSHWDTGTVPATGEPGGTIVVFGSNIASVQNLPGLVIDRVVLFGSGNAIGGGILGLSGAVLSPSVQDFAGGNQFAGDLTIDLTSSAPVNWVVSAGTLTVLADLTGSPSSFTLSGNVALDGDNSYTGTTIVKSGLVTLDSPTGNGAITGNSLWIGDGTGAAGSAIVREMSVANIADGAGVLIEPDGRLDLNGFDEKVWGIETPGLSGPFGNVTLGGGTLSVQVTGGFYVHFDGVISGTGGLVKLGTGTQRLLGNNSYTGSTTVSAGILSIEGTQTASPVIVGNGGILTGFGTIGSLTVQSGGTLDPGSPAIPDLALHASVVSLAPGAYYHAFLYTKSSVPASNLLLATGGVGLNGATLVPTLSYAPSPGDQLIIISSASGSLFNTFAGIPGGSRIVVSGAVYSVNYTSSQAILTACMSPASVVAPAAVAVTQTICN